MQAPPARLAFAFCDFSVVSRRPPQAAVPVSRRATTLCASV